MTFGKRLMQLRKEKGFTREAFAEHLNMSKYTLRNYEMNTHEPNSDFLIMLSRYFDVSIDYLMGMTEEKERIRPYELKSSEYEHIEKYRSLDNPGKERIDFELNKELMRVEELQKQQKQIADQQDQIHQLKQRIVTELIHRIVLPLYARFASAGGGEYLFDDIPTDTIEVEDTPTARRADFVIGVNGDSMEPDFYDGEKVFVEKTADLNVGDIGIFLKGNDCYLKELGADRLISHNKAYEDIAADDEIKTIGKVIGKVQMNI